MEFISPFRLVPGRLRASSGKRQRTLEVDGGAQQLQMAGVAAEPDVADAAEAVTAFHDPEAALDAARIAATALLNQVCHGFSGLLRAALYIRPSAMPASASRSRKPCEA